MPQYSITAKSVALVASTAKTIAQVRAAANRRLKLVGFHISFDGTSSGSVPVDVEIQTQTTDGTGTSVTPVPVRESDPAMIGTAVKNFTGEPNAGNPLYAALVTPNGGLFDYRFPKGEEPEVNVSGRIGVKAIAGAGVNATVTLIVEE